MLFHLLYPLSKSLVLASDMPPQIDATYDLGNGTFFGLIGHRDRLWVPVDFRVLPASLKRVFCHLRRLGLHLRFGVKRMRCRFERAFGERQRRSRSG